MDETILKNVTQICYEMDRLTKEQHALDNQLKKIVKDFANSDLETLERLYQAMTWTGVTKYKLFLIIEERKNLIEQGDSHV